MRFSSGHSCLIVGLNIRIHLYKNIIFSEIGVFEWAVLVVEGGSMRNVLCLGVCLPYGRLTTIMMNQLPPYYN